MVGDKAVGAYLTLMPEYCFVLESTLDNSILAFAATAPDAVQFHTRNNGAWLPEMREKYPRKVNDLSAEAMSMLSPIEEMMLSFHTDEETVGLPVCLTSPPDHLSSGSGSSSAEGISLPWGLINLYITPTVSNDHSISKRLAMCCMACLRASGTIRAYSEIRTRDSRSKDLYAMMGFSAVSPLPMNNDSPSSPSAEINSGASGSNGTPPSGQQSKYIYMTRNF